MPLRRSRLARRSISWIVLAASAVAAHAQIAGDALPYELCTIDAIGASGGAVHRIIDTTGFTCGSPDWSPDGKQIAFDTWRVGQTHNDSQIAVIRADGSDLRLLGPGGMPSFSPDGTHLVCHTYDNPQTIVVMNADGRGRETISNHWGSPRWSPRGNFIASLDTNKQILIFDLATGKEHGILPRTFAGPYYFSQIGFGIAPDGRRIAFGDGDGMFLVTVDAHAIFTSIRWPVKGGLVRHCSWSPDSKRVVFGWQKSTSEPQQIFTLDVDSTDAPTWLPGQDPLRSNACPDWSPDGKTIVFVRQMALSESNTTTPQPDATKP